MHLRAQLAVGRIASVLKADFGLLKYCQERGTWHVGKDGGAKVELADAQVGHERGEGVVSNLGPRIADDAQQRALAGVGHADDAHVRHQAQLQVQPRRLPRLPDLCKLRRAAWHAVLIYSHYEI